MDHLFITLHPCVRRTLLYIWTSRVRTTLDDLAQGGRSLKKSSSLTFVPVTDGANACGRNLLGTNVHGKGGGSVLRHESEQLSIRSTG